MSAPVKPTREDLIQLMMMETISTMSSLHMYPEPILDLTEEQLENPFGVFLSEGDRNAEHAIKHLENLVEIVKCAMHLKNKLTAKIHHLRNTDVIGDEAFDILLDIAGEF